MEQNLWEADMSAACQEIPRILWNQKFRYRIYKSPPTLFILNKINADHAFASDVWKIQFNIILPSTPGSFFIFEFPCITSL